MFNHTATARIVNFICVVVATARFIRASYSPDRTFLLVVFPISFVAFCQSREKCFTVGLNSR